MSNILPTTISELRPWLKRQMPKLTDRMIDNLIMPHVYSDYEAKTFAEGWEAAQTNTVDPARFKNSLKSMKDSGRL